MPKNDSIGGRKAADTLLVALLASGESRRSAAAKAGVSESLVYRRLKDPQFLNAVEAARAELIDQALGRLSQLADAAVITLGLLLKSDADTVRLGAARAILQSLLQTREQVTLASEMAELRLIVEEQQGGRRWAA